MMPGGAPAPGGGKGVKNSRGEGLMCLQMPQCPVEGDRERERE